MTESTIPDTEATEDTAEVVHYELAFHVLPTVAEGEVTDVFTALKEVVTSAGGTLVAEEAPQRFELAYPIVRRTEGKNRLYKSAYFGWVQFTLTTSEVAGVLAAVEARPNILRALVIKLTAEEITHPFFFHAALETKKVVTIDESEMASVAAEAAAEAKKENEDDETKEEKTV